MIVAKGNPLNLHSYEDVAKHDKAILAVAPGSMEQKYAEAAEIPADRVRLLSLDQIGLEAVRTGQVDALALPAVEGQEMVEKAGGAVELPDPFHDPIYNGKPAISYSAYGIRKQDADLRDALNEALDKIINTDAHLAVVEPFGFSRQQLPGNKTTDQICGGD